MEEEKSQEFKAIHEFYGMGRIHSCIALNSWAIFNSQVQWKKRNPRNSKRYMNFMKWEEFLYRFEFLGNFQLSVSASSPASTSFRRGKRRRLQPFEIVFVLESRAGFENEGDFSKLRTCFRNPQTRSRRRKEAETRAIFVKESASLRRRLHV